MYLSNGSIGDPCVCVYFYAMYVCMCLDPAAVTNNAKMASGQGAEALKNVITKGRLSDAH